MRWPPSGKRGVAFSRANMFGKNFSEYRKEAQQPLLIAMIEHINAIEDLDSILQIKELDAILIGPYDLSASMGITAELDNKDFIKVIHDIKEKSTKAKISCGIHVVEPSLNELIKRIDENYSFIAYAMDSVFLSEFSILPKIK